MLEWAREILRIRVTFCYRVNWTRKKTRGYLKTKKEKYIVIDWKPDIGTMALVAVWWKVKIKLNSYDMFSSSFQSRRMLFLYIDFYRSTSLSTFPFDLESFDFSYFESHCKKQGIAGSSF